MDTDLWNVIITGAVYLTTAIGLYKYQLLPNPKKWISKRRARINEEREALYVWYHDKTGPLVERYLQDNDYWPGKSSPLRASHYKEHSAWEKEFQTILESDSAKSTVINLIENRWDKEKEKIRQQALMIKKTLDGLPEKARQEYIMQVAYDEMIQLRDLEIKIEKAKNEALGLDV